MARRQFRKLNGILLLDKSLGLSSNKALQDVRFLYQAAKAGHTGSLDPLASGMLPVCFGDATKVSAFLLDANKRYLTTATLGATSSTGDAEGELDVRGSVPDLSTFDIEGVLAQFRGDIQQVPPMYSALKKDGQPLYKLARQGVEVERVARDVCIHELILHKAQGDCLELEVHSSKGTYIRSLVQDIGEAIGCGAYVSKLRRSEVFPFNNLPMYTFEFLKEVHAQGGQEALDELLLPMDKALPHLPDVVLNEAQVERLRQGQKLSLNDLPTLVAPGLLKVYTEAGVFAGLAEVDNVALKPKRLLACP